MCLNNRPNEEFQGKKSKLLTSILPLFWLLFGGKTNRKLQAWRADLIWSWGSGQLWSDRLMMQVEEICDFTGGRLLVLFLSIYILCSFIFTPLRLRKASVWLVVPFRIQYFLPFLSPVKNLSSPNLVILNFNVNEKMWCSFLGLENSPCLWGVVCVVMMQ